jgi:hypothetical protein
MSANRDRQFCREARQARTFAQRREVLETALERLLSVAEAIVADLDTLDDDSDLEPSLGLLEASEPWQRAFDQSWVPRQGADDDREVQCEDEGAQCEDEGHDSDTELCDGDCDDSGPLHVWSGSLLSPAR